MRTINKIKPYLYVLVISLIFLLVCSKNSPLYEMNDWVDANAFFTVGKSMVRGVVPYKGLFEQKGPLLYLIYGIGSLISFDSFFGVFILEVIAFSIFLLYSFKIMNLFLDVKKSYLLIPIYTLLIVTLKSFSHGGSAEEFSLPFLMYSMYIFIKYLKTGKITKKELFITGLMSGSIFYIKYTLLGFNIGFMLSLCIIEILKKNYKILMKYIIFFILGFVAISIPWIVYFILTNSLKEMIDVYFLINIKIYPKTSSILFKIYKTIKLVFSNLFGNLVYFVFIVLGFISLFTHKKVWKIKYSNIALLTCLVMSGIFIYIGGTNYHYYPLILSPFILVGLICFMPNIKINYVSIFIVILFSFIASTQISNNVKMINNDSNYYAQNIFSEIINKKENATILNYGFLDGGFYLKTRIIPKYYYFMKNNIPYKNYPEMLDSQLNYIETTKVDYVIIRSKASGKLKSILSEKYRLVKTHKQIYQEKEYTYRLYKLLER